MVQLSEVDSQKYHLLQEYVKSDPKASSSGIIPPSSLSYQDTLLPVKHLLWNPSLMHQD